MAKFVGQRRRPGPLHTERRLSPSDGPLAGLALRLHVKVRDVREASDEEIEAGTLGNDGFTVLNTAPSGTQAH